MHCWAGAEISHNLAASEVWHPCQHAIALLVLTEVPQKKGPDAELVALQVIEAAIENVKLKQQIFADLEKACKPDAILSSNTSTIDISLVRMILGV